VSGVVAESKCYIGVASSSLGYATGDGDVPMAATTPAATEVASTAEQIAAQAQHSPTTRRRQNGRFAYAVQCWAPRSAFADPVCNCLGVTAHPKLGSRRTTTIVVGTWCVH
jgi:hypothetical protein